MKESVAKSKFHVTCPKGHKLLGGTLLLGKTVRCPKCHEKFVFAPTLPERPRQRQITESGVMRILGEMTPPQERTPTEEARSATAPTRPCPGCGVAIQESLTVCNHCNCYVGVLPSFLRQITPASQAN